MSTPLPKRHSILQTTSDAISPSHSPSHPGINPSTAPSTSPSTSLFIPEKICPPDGITRGAEKLASEGFGSCVLNLMTAYIYATIHNRTFCVTPWRRMGHRLNGTKFFNFIGGPSYGPSANNDTELYTKGVFEVFGGGVTAHDHDYMLVPQVLLFFLTCMLEIM